MPSRLLGVRGALAGLACCAASLLLAVPAAAAPAAGSLDASFGTGGFATLSLGAWVGAAAVVVQKDGKIVTAGEGSIGGHNVMVATRMNANGSLDSSFGTGGVETVNINGGAGVDSGAALALQSNGKIVMVGTGEQTIYGPLQFAAVRLNTNGAPDPAFGNAGVAVVPVGSTSIANAVAIQPDGKILLGGTALVSHNEFAAARLNADGTLDASFGNGGSITFDPTGGAWGMALQKDGKVVLAGQADYDNPQVSGAQQFMAARLTAAGQPDPGFGRSGVVMIPVGATALGYGVALQGDGKLVLAGPAFTNTGVNATVRLNTDGSLDSTYGTAGIGTIPDWYGANGIILDSAGRAVLPSVGASAVVMGTGGVPVSGFGTGGSALVNTPPGGANGAAMQSDGKIVLAGAATVNGQTVLSVIRLNGLAPSSGTTTGTTTSTTGTTTSTTGTTTSTTGMTSTTSTTTPTTSIGSTKTTTTSTTSKPTSGKHSRVSKATLRRQARSAWAARHRHRIRWHRISSRCRAGALAGMLDRLERCL